MYMLLLLVGMELREEVMDTGLGYELYCTGFGADIGGRWYEEVDAAEISGEWSFIRSDCCSQLLFWMTGTARGSEDEFCTEAGETEPFLVEDDGESADEDSRLDIIFPPEVPVTGVDDDSPPLGLSLPVGPLPNGARFAGGKLRAARRWLFSSSSSDTRHSRAYRALLSGNLELEKGGTHLKMGCTTSTKCALDIAGTVGR